MASAMPKPAEEEKEAITRKLQEINEETKVFNSLKSRKKIEKAEESQNNRNIALPKTPALEILRVIVFNDVLLASRWAPIVLVEFPAYHQL